MNRSTFNKNHVSGRRFNCLLSSLKIPKRRVAKRRFPDPNDDLKGTK